MKIRLISLFSLILVLCLYSCNSSSNNQETDTKVADLDEIIQTAGAISPEVTSIKDVFKTLDLSDAKYYPVLCNDPYNAEKYKKNDAVAAANLGVYIGDIVYHMYGEATKDMYLTFSAAQELARSIGIDSEFGATLLTELEGGKISRDSLITAFNDLMVKSKDYNSSVELIHVHTAFLTGLYFEKLFITSSLIEQLENKKIQTPKNIENFKEMFIVFNKQLSTISVLKNSLDKHKEKLESIFNYDEIQNLMISAIALNKASDDILNSDKIDTIESLSTIHKQISNIRTGIISAS